MNRTKCILASVGAVVAGVSATLAVGAHEHGHDVATRGYKPADCFNLTPRANYKTEVCFPDVDGYEKHLIGRNEVGSLGSFRTGRPGVFVREVGAMYFPSARSTERRHLQIGVIRYVPFPTTAREAHDVELTRARAARVLVGASLYDEDGDIHGLLERLGDELVFHCRPLEPLAVLYAKEHRLKGERYQRDDVKGMVESLVRRYLAEDPPATPVACS